MTGKVFLVGAGPGDAELITVRGLRCIQKADVLVYDRLIPMELLEDAPTHCEKIYVGKRKHLHIHSQDNICHMLVHHAMRGKSVVRLKGGDPFIFGRGGEEIDMLIDNDIDWEVIPGVTAVSGAAAAVGLPLTHRNESQALTLITAHRKNGEFSIDWDLVLNTRQTVAFYMALTCAKPLVDGLLARGKSPSTLFTVIANATRRNEVMESCRLDEAAALLSSRDFASPTLLVLGPAPRKQSSTGVIQQISAYP